MSALRIYLSTIPDIYRLGRSLENSIIESLRFAHRCGLWAVDVYRSAP
jgi:hypothetical protein